MTGSTLYLKSCSIAACVAFLAACDEEYSFDAEQNNNDWAIAEDFDAEGTHRLSDKEREDQAKERTGPTYYRVRNPATNLCLSTPFSNGGDAQATPCAWNDVHQWWRLEPGTGPEATRFRSFYDYCLYNRSWASTPKPVHGWGCWNDHNMNYTLEIAHDVAGNDIPDAWWIVHDNHSTAIGLVEENGNYRVASIYHSAINPLTDWRLDIIP